MVLDCFSALNDYELDENERLFACLLIFFEDFNDVEDIFKLSEDEIAELLSEVFKWFNCGQSDSLGAKNYKLIDWDEDSQMICSAVNKVAGFEIRGEAYVHWWTFMGYYSAVGESTLSTVVAIREKIIHGKKLEKWEREFRQNNPQMFVWNKNTEQDKADDDLIQKLWRGEI
jgi:hypothetical protein